MRPVTVFLTASLLALIFGAAFLAAPAAVLQVYGVSADRSTVMMSRFFGVALVQLGLTVYLLRETRDATTIRSIALPGTAGSLCGALVAVMGVLNGVTNALGWSTVVIYTVLLLGYATCLRGSPAEV